MPWVVLAPALAADPTDPVDAELVRKWTDDVEHRAFLALPTFSTIGALLVDVAVLTATIWYGWLPEEAGA